MVNDLSFGYLNEEICYIQKFCCFHFSVMCVAEPFEANCHFTISKAVTR